MKISVFGLGYVGIVSCACFAKYEHEIIGVDTNEEKIKLIQNKKSTIVEEGLDELLIEGINKNLITATNDFNYAILNTDISIICVGTPSQQNGNIDLTYIYNVVDQIGQSLRDKNTYHTILIRSTVAPGTVRQSIKRIENISGKVYERDFAVASNPEFLREGSAIADFFNPPYTIIGTDSDKCAKIITSLYSSIEAPIYTLLPEESEMIKYANNNFHALKITFANELGNICKALKIDGEKVMDVVSKDTKLNLSPYYMKPGFAFGGSCLPKDVRGLSYQAKVLDVKTPLLNSILESNDYQIQKGLQLIYSTGKKRIGVLGFAFKAGTDDLRESPMVTLIETLIGKGYEVLVYDKSVNLSNLLGKNKEFINSHIPHIYKLIRDQIEDIIDYSDVIVIGNKSSEFKSALHYNPDKTIIDLVRIDNAKTTEKGYVGICW